MIVLDTSLVGPVTIPDEDGSLPPDAVVALLDTKLVVPGHWHLEVANMFRTAVRRRGMTMAERKRGLTLLRGLDIEVDRETVDRAWTSIVTLADSLDLPPYDAAYLELAVRGIPLATSDSALARAARQVGAQQFGTQS